MKLKCFYKIGLEARPPDKYTHVFEMTGGQGAHRTYLTCSGLQAPVGVFADSPQAAAPLASGWC